MVSPRSTAVTVTGTCPVGSGAGGGGGRHSMWALKGFTHGST
jgi:hypothetical protein